MEIDHFAAYDGNENASRLVFSYNQSVRNTADSLRACTDESFEDFNHFIKLWQREDDREKMVGAFGKDQIDFTPLSLRVNAHSHDRHIVKYNFIFLVFLSSHKFV